MHMAQQIIGLTLAASSVLFMLWFLQGLIRESRTRYPRHAHPPVNEAVSYPPRTFSPQAPSSSANTPHSPDRGAHATSPQITERSRSLHIASR
jgi:hypothetical protein